MIKCFILSFSFFLISSSLYADLTDDIEELEGEENLEKPINKSKKHDQRDKKKTKHQKVKAKSSSSSQTDVKKGSPDLQKKPLQESPQKEANSVTSGNVKAKAKDSKLEKSKRLPVIFEGDQLSGFRKLGTLELQSNVQIRQGNFFLKADHAKVIFNTETDEVEKVIAKGNVQMSKKDPKTGDPIQAYSQIAEFDAINQSIILSDKAKLVRGADIIRGRVINYDLKTGWLQASQVKGTVKPENTNSQEQK